MSSFRSGVDERSAVNDSARSRKLPLQPAKAHYVRWLRDASVVGRMRFQHEPADLTDLTVIRIIAVSYLRFTGLLECI